MRLLRKSMRPGTVFVHHLNRHCWPWKDVALRVVDEKFECQLGRSAKATWCLGDVCPAQAFEVLAAPPRVPSRTLDCATDCTYHYYGRQPDLNSDEWIEYIPDPKAAFFRAWESANADGERALAKFQADLARDKWG